MRKRRNGPVPMSRLPLITGNGIPAVHKPWPSKAGAEDVDGGQSAPLITEDGTSGQVQSFEIHLRDQGQR